MKEILSYLATFVGGGVVFAYFGSGIKTALKNLRTDVVNDIKAELAKVKL